MSYQLSELFGVANLDLSWLASFFSLLLLPFAHEDLAIVFGGYVVVNDIMPVGPVVLGIYGGMVASDCALYGLGVGARHIPWLGRMAVNDRVKGIGDALKRDVFGLVALCRVVPGLGVVALVACGLTRVPLTRFMLASAAVSALYLPLMLYLVVVFGDALTARAGLWTWPFLLGIVVAAGFIRYRVFTLRDVAPAVGVTGVTGAAPLRPSRPIRVPQALIRSRSFVRPGLAGTHASARAAQWISLR